MSVVARDPDVGVVPVAALLGVDAEPRHELVDDADGVANDRGVVALRVRALVDTGERREDEVGALVAHTPNDFLDHVAIDVEPAADVAAEVGPGDARGRRRDARAGREAAADHAQRADAPRSELEQCRRRRIQVTIDAPHLMPDVAPRERGKRAGRAAPVEPPQPWKTDRARIAAHEKWR